MSSDFWAGYASGALGIVVGNPLDLIKVRLQAQTSETAHRPLPTTAALTIGTAAPIIVYGALNALLFVSYNQSESALRGVSTIADRSLLRSWLAGAIGGLATWVISAPTELVKCQTQASVARVSSYVVARRVLQENGLKGFYSGGTVTALRDSIGYGFYFWSYQLSTSLWPVPKIDDSYSFRLEASRVLLCGGFAGVATWTSVFPLDVIKTRIQTQAIRASTNSAPFAKANGDLRRDSHMGALRMSHDLYREHGLRVFFRGFTVCCIRAFFVNAIQWAAYEGIMRQLSPQPE